MENTAENNSKVILKVLFGFSIAFIIGALCAGDWSNLIPGFVRICTRPSQFTMDSFVLGGLGGAFLNTGMVGLACCGLLYFSKAKCTGLTVAAYWLTVGFATFGMTFTGIWPFFFGVWVYSRIKKVSYGSVANLAMFSSALAPFANELLFRYPNLQTAEIAEIGEFLSLSDLSQHLGVSGLALTGEIVRMSGFTFTGLILTILLGILVGCTMPALCAHAPNFHKGYDLYSAGPAAGLLAFFIFCVLYKSPGVEVPTNTCLGDGEKLFVNVFFITLFVLCLVVAYMLDKNCFKDYKKLWVSDGYKTDYTATFGMPATMVNFGMYGLFIMVYYNVVQGMTMVDGNLLFTGAKFTGATMGAIMCMYAFVAQGAQPRTVFPLMIGYAIASLLPFFMYVGGITEVQNWTLTTQAILVGMCFCSGLAPVTGKWGFWPGVIAGAMHAIMVMSVPLWHGGFCLYNGGFTAGIVAFLLVPVLEWFTKPKEEKKGN